MRDSNCRPSGSSASHSRTLPAHGPPQTSSGSTPHLSTYIRTQRPREVHSRLPLSGHNTLSFETPLQGPVTEREDAATPRAREARHCVNRQGQACLYPQRDRLREQLQPASCSNPSHSTTYHAPNNNYMLWSPHSFPRLLQSLSNHLHRG
jgi:hypothetical protein